MPKCDFNKLPSQNGQTHSNNSSAKIGKLFDQFAKATLLKLDFGMVFPVNLLHLFRTPSPKNTSGRLLLCYINMLVKS